MSEAKKITFEYEGEEYTLEYNRRAVERMEKAGFEVNAILTHQLTAIPELFYGAFYMHHKGIKKEYTDEMLNSFKNVSDLAAKLAEMYVQPLNALLSDSDEKNTPWEANW